VVAIDDIKAIRAVAQMLLRAGADTHRPDTMDELVEDLRFLRELRLDSERREQQRRALFWKVAGAVATTIVGGLAGAFAGAPQAVKKLFLGD
jgi:hypothetical protein